MLVRLLGKRPSDLSEGLFMYLNTVNTPDFAGTKRIHNSVKAVYFYMPILFLPEARDNDSSL